MSGKEKSSRRRGGHPGGAHGGGHHGGAWKVAYADFTTAMMAFFMLMWILAASSPKQKQAIAQYFRSEGHFKDGGSSMTGSFNGGPGIMQMPMSSGIVQEAQTLELMAKELGDELEKEGEAGLSEMKDQVSITLTDDGLVIEITDDSKEELFAVGGAVMNPAFEKTLAAVAAQLKGLPNEIRLEGYTDARPYPPGGDYSNWELSADRANAVRRYLEKSGLPRERFESVVGYGDGKLAAPARPLAPANRRITITVLREHAVKPASDEPPIEAPVTGFRPFGAPVPASEQVRHDAAPADSAPHGAAGSDRNER